MGYTKEKTNKQIIIFGISLLITYFFAYFFDALFHYFENGTFSGGITYIAGFFGGIISFILFTFHLLKEERKNIYKILNLIIPGVVLAHAIGRIGCFSVGCCYGKPTNSIFGVYFPVGTNPYIDGIREKVHPTQLYEAFFLVFLFFGLRSRFAKNRELPLYLILYGVFRFILEIFFRGDDRGKIFGVAPSVILSIFMFLGGIILLLIRKKNGEVNESLLSK